MLTGAVNQNNMHKKVTQQTVNLISVFMMEGTRLQIYMQPTSPPQRGGALYWIPYWRAFCFEFNMTLTACCHESTNTIFHVNQGVDRDVLRNFQCE